MRHAVAQDLRRDRGVIRGGGGGGDRQRIDQRRQARQPRQHLFGRDAEIDQAGNLVSPRRAQFREPRRAVVDRAEKALRLEIPLEGVVEHRLHLLGGQRVGVDRPLGVAPERGKGRRVIGDEAGGGAQIGLHRPARDLARDLAALVEIGVQHHRHPERRRIVPRLDQRRAPIGDAGAQILYALPQKMGQHVGPDAPRLAPALGIARDGEP